jgi:YbbR domain-containing protein
MKKFLLNLDLKIWAIVIATFLWFHVTTEKTYEEFFQVPVFIPPPEGLVQVNSLPNTITLTLKGTGKELLRLKWFSSLKASVKLPKVKKGKMNLPLSRNNINLLPEREVEIVFIDPPEALLEFDQPTDKKVKVSPQIVGVPEKGFLWVGEAELSSTAVTLWGGKKRVRATDSLLTDTLYLTNRDKSFQKNVAIFLPPGEGFRIAPESVTVSISIEEVIERSFSDIPIQLLNKPRRWKAAFNPEKGEIIMAGPKSAIENIQDENLVITLNLKGKRKGEFDIPTNFEPPSGLTVISTNPEYFKVTLK